jgi:hypothetical protein
MTGRNQRWLTTGCPLLDALSPPVHGRRRAGRAASRSTPPTGPPPASDTAPHWKTDDPLTLTSAPLTAADTETRGWGVIPYGGGGHLRRCCVWTPARCIPENLRPCLFSEHGRPPRRVPGAPTLRSCLPVRGGPDPTGPGAPGGLRGCGTRPVEPTSRSRPAMWSPPGRRGPGARPGCARQATLSDERTRPANTRAARLVDLTAPEESHPTEPHPQKGSNRDPDRRATAAPAALNMALAAPAATPARAGGCGPPSEAARRADAPGQRLGR